MYDPTRMPNSSSLRSLFAPKSRSRTPPKVAPGPAAQRRYRRRMREQGAEILKILKQPKLDNRYSRELLLCHRDYLRQICPRTIPQAALSSERVLNTDPLTVPEQLSVASDCRFDSACAASAAPFHPTEFSMSLYGERVVGEDFIGRVLGFLSSHRSSFQFNPDAPIFIPSFPTGGTMGLETDVASCKLRGDFRSLPICEWARIHDRFRKPHESIVAMVQQALVLPGLQRDHSRTMAEHNTSEHNVTGTCENFGAREDESSDVLDSDSGLAESYEEDDFNDEFDCESPSDPRGWYINLVPERYKWEPTAGLGHLEWNELVQSTVLIARKMLTDFSGQSFPVLAARRLIAILAVQTLKQSWLQDDFGALFANRFRHPELVSKGLDAIAESVSGSYTEKKQLFIDKGIVSELLVET